MTSSEVKPSGNTTHLIPKKMGNDTVVRKASFKYSVPNKTGGQRIARKVVVPISTVQALTFKFNELSKLGDGQNQKLKNATVKNILGVGGKTSTIKVVICRKPSISRYKRSEEVVVRRKINVRRFPPGSPIAFQENQNVPQKVSQFEEKEKTEISAKFISAPKSNKVPVPKILVDIDLGADNCSFNRNRRNNEGNSQSLSVRTAISLFEQNFKTQEKNSALRERLIESNKSKRNSDSGGFLNQSDAISEVKTKPIAAIKPILKKPNEKTVRKTKLLPKDSLNRKKYLQMKRESSRTNINGKENSDGDNSRMGKDVVLQLSRSDAENETEASEENWSKEKISKNVSSLHGHLGQSSLAVLTDEISLRDEYSSSEKANAETGGLNPNLKPNTSFLWSKKDDPLPERRPVSRVDLPLPVPPENFVPDILDKSDTFYDDVMTKGQKSESEEEFEKITDSEEEETYDDVGLYWRKNEGQNKGENCTSVEFVENRVREQNILNRMADFKSEATYDCPEKLYVYDDGEGERYQYISDMSDPVHSNTKENELELYQYIQSKDDTNIYEDIQSIKNHFTTKDRSRDLYEDINCLLNSGTDNPSVNNCYESVYNGIYSNNNGIQAYIKSDLSDASNNSMRSAYEKSNSLYGMSAENGLANGSPRSIVDANDSSEVSGYHFTLFGSACPNSETSQSNSDDWVEVSESESEQTVYLIHERPRRTKSGGNSWTQKERRRWKRLQRITNANSDEPKLQNSDDHLYESVGQYENAEVIQEAKKILEAEQANNNGNKEFYADEQYVDDFDSQSSEDEAYTEAKLPSIPNHGYNITKSLKAAGKKLRKNFSLRKSDLSKSLKRFKKSSRPKIQDLVFTKETNSSEKGEGSPTPTGFNDSIYSNTSDSSNSYNSCAKNNGFSNESKSQRHRKSWTFRNKFKSSSLDSSETNSGQVDANRNSTFYLSLNEVQPQKSEKKIELLNEIQSAISKRNSNSSESVTEKPDKEFNTRPLDSCSTSAKFRPNVPPPPPPPLNKMEITPEKTKYSDILWGEKATNNCLYVESGLFDKQKKLSRCTDSDTSLYAEIGLYATNDELNSKKTQMFVDEPLYQFYTECVNQRARDDILNNYDSEGYEEINDYYSVINEKRRTIDIKNVRPFEDVSDDVRSKISSLRSISDRRTLWCQIPAVVDSCILQTLSDQARKLQEAKFEIITSEGSYMNSLNVLENHFMKKVNDLNIITKRDFRILFSNIVSVKKCSESFLEDLENCWQNNIMLTGICDIVYKHSKTSFQVYTKYCKNQVCIYRTLRELLDKNWNFENALKEIESDPICQNLNIHSFLMLPMQRITRLPLLMGAVLARMDKDDDEYDVCKASFDILNKIVQDCDDEARRMEKCEEMLILSQQIEFPKDIRRIPIITGSRFLVKSGQVTQLVNRDENKLTFGKKFSKITLTLFLFTDLLLVAKKKNPRNYVVVDHCPRNLVQMQTTDGLTQLPVKLNTNSDMGGKLLMLLTMLENHEKKTAEMILSFDMESDKQRWLEAVTPKLSENPDECIYEEWDCPQVIALYEFTPVQPDELNLCIGDVVNVLKKMNDGWYQGERLRDGARGWFPQNHTQEVSSSHIRAKNKKLRYKLLALSGNLIDSQKVNGK